MSDATTQQHHFTVHVSPLDEVGDPLVRGNWLDAGAVNWLDAARQVQAQLAALPFGEGVVPWSVCDQNDDEVWHYTDGPLEER